MRTVLACAVALVLFACSKTDSAEARAVCEKAADRWSACMSEIGGKSMAKMADEKRDIGACASDEKTVSMYKDCLPKASCTEMMECMMSKVR